MAAGPLEVLVVADKHANPTLIASDLLSHVQSFCNVVLYFLWTISKMIILHFFVRP